MATLAEIGFKANTSDIDKADRKLDKLGNTGTEAQGKINGLINTVGVLGAALTALGSIAIADQLMAYSESWKMVSNQLKIVVSSEEELIKTRLQLIDLSKDTNSEIGATTALYSELFRNTRQLGTEQTTVLGVTKTLNNLFVAGAKDANTQASAIRQLSQALGTGALRGDEYISVTEAAPRIIDALAESLGMAKGQMRDFAATGGITSQVLIDALTKYSDTAQDLFNKVDKTFAQSMENSKTNITQYVGEFGALGGIIDSVGLGIEELTEDIGALVDAGQTLVTIIAMGLTPAVLSYMGSLVSTTAAQLLAGTTAIRTANAFGQVTVTAASATVATNALGIASRFLLGPWGLLLMAAGAAAAVFMTSRDESDRLTQSLLKQGVATDTLKKSLVGLNSNQLQSAMLSANEQNLDLLYERYDLEKKIRETQLMGIMGGSNGKELASLNSDLEALDEQILVSNNTLSAMKDQFDDLFQKGETEKIADAAAEIKRIADAALFAKTQMGKWVSSVENFQTPLQQLESELARVNAGLSSGVIDETSGTLGYINKLKLSIAGLNEKIEGDDKYQMWVDAIASEGNTAKISALKDEITNVWIAMDAGDLDTKTGLDYIDEMEKRVISLQGTISGSDMFGMVTDSAKGALSSVQDLHEKGSSGYKKLGVAIQAMSAAQAIFAVLNQASGDPYTAFGRMAAMVGAVGALGFGVSGLGGGFSDSTAQDNQADQGLTIWGDKSESISNAIEMTANATDKLVTINTGMLNALTGLQQGISNVAGIAIRGTSNANFETGDLGVIGNVYTELFSGIGEDFGDVLNILSGGLFKVIGSFLGGSSKTTDSGIKISGSLTGDADIMGFQTTEYKKWKWGSKKVRNDFFDLGGDINKQFGLVFMDIADSVAQGAKALGFSSTEIQQAINDFEIQSQTISLKGLSTEQQEEEIQAVFSSIFDSVAGDVIPFIGEFQKTGEGLGETLARVATQVQVAEVLANQLGVTLGDKMANPHLFATIADNLATMTGGLEAFAEKTSMFIESFAPDSVKFEMASESLTRSLSDVGLNVPTSAAGFWELMQSLDGTTEAGQEQIAALLNAQGVASEYFKMLESNEQEKLSEELKKQSEAKAETDAYNNSLQGLSDSLRNVAEQMVGGGEGDLDSALSAALSGDFTEAMNLNLASLNDDESSFQSSNDFLIAQAVTASKLNQIAELGDAAQTHEENMLQESKDQTDQLISLNEKNDKFSDTLKKVVLATEATDNKLLQLQLSPQEVRIVT